MIDAWSASSALNPRLLASELAALLRALAPASQPIGAHAATVVMFDTASGSGTLSFGTLAAYFERYSAEGVANTVETTTGSARAAAVYLARSWIGPLEVDTEARARIAAGLQQAHPAPRPSGGAQPADQHQPPMSGSDPECLALHQAQQRQAGERSAAEQLEAARLAQQKAEQEAEKAQARASVAIQQLAALHHENGRLQGELNTSARQLRAAQDDACDLEAELEQLTLFAECLRHDNPLSPPELRLAFQCWCDLTQNGQHNPAGKGGRGVHGQVEAWVRAQGLDLNRDQLARLQAVVSWRKRGSGAIASH